jgi:hypothetical protein
LTFRFIKIDDALRGEHYYLTAEDECYCLGEYQPRGGYGAGAVNDMLSNFKKPVTKRGLPEYRYKERDILRAGRFVRGALSPNAVTNFTYVPVPPSKAKSDPLYDDRLVRALTSGQPVLDVRELIVMRQSVRAHHEYASGEKRPTPDELYDLLAIDPACLNPPLKGTVVIFDDLLTNGTHFKACQRILLETVPGTRIIGLFIGRRKSAPLADVFSDLTGAD